MTQSATMDAEPSEVGVGIDSVLADLVRRAVRSTPDIASLAIGDSQGLPILNATRGRASVMTHTAMATMSMRAARTALEAFGMKPPEYLVAQSPSGTVVMMNCTGSMAVLIAQLREGSNMGLCLVVLKRLAEQVGAALSE